MCYYIGAIERGTDFQIYKLFTTKKHRARII